MRATARRELLASRAEVWRFLSEPYHLPDWWPGILGVEPDRRGLAPGARWALHCAPQATLIRRQSAVRPLLLVREVEPYERLGWHLTVQRLDVEVRLHAAGPDRTIVDLELAGPWRLELLGGPRRLPERALRRLYDLCQTAASL